MKTVFPVKVSEWVKERYPNVVDFYFNRDDEVVENLLDKSLEAFKEFKEENVFLYPEGYDPYRSKEFEGVTLPVVGDGKVYGKTRIDAVLSHYIQSPLEIRSFNPKGTVYLSSDALIYFPPIEWRENWEKKDVGFCKRDCLWKVDDLIPAFIGKRLEFFTPQKISKDGFLEVNAIIQESPIGKNFEITNEEGHYLGYFLDTIYGFIKWNRFQLLYYTGRISEEDFIRYYVHSNTIWSLFKVKHPSYVGREAWLKLVNNVLIPANEQLLENSKAIVELEDVREFGLIKEQNRITGKVPVRITIYDWDRVSVFPLPTEAVVYAEDDFYSFPIPEEVEAMGIDLASMYERTVKDAEQSGYNKKGNPFYEDYLSKKNMIRVEREVFPTWWRKLWSEMKKFVKEN